MQKLFKMMQQSSKDAKLKKDANYQKDAKFNYFHIKRSKEAGFDPRRTQNLTKLTLKL